MKDYISSIERATTVASVVEQLRKKIILGAYPVGELITENNISEECGVSRSSIRTALHVLEQEGLIKVLPNGRKLVVGLSEKDIHDLYQVRSLLECSAVELILKRSSINYATLANKVHDFEELLDEQEEKVVIKRRNQVNLEFHRTLLEMSNNQSLLRCWTLEQPLMSVLSEINSENLTTGTHLEEYVQKHSEILRMLLTKDFSVVEYVKQHVEEDALNTTLLGLKKRQMR